MEDKRSLKKKNGELVQARTTGPKRSRSPWSIELSYISA